MGLMKANKRVSVPELSFKRQGTPTRYNGNVAQRVVQAVFNPSANTGERTIAAHGLGVYIPDNAIITNAWFDVITTFTSATDAATIALMAQSAGDLKAAIAISAAGDVYDAGIHGCLPGSYAEATVAGDTAILDAARKAASYIKLSAEREITVTVAVEALTAGKMVIYVEYVLGD
jgi:hypothetical protein